MTVDFFSLIYVIGINAVISHTICCCIKNKFGDYCTEKKFGDQKMLTLCEKYIKRRKIIAILFFILFKKNILQMQLLIPRFSLTCLLIIDK